MAAWVNIKKIMIYICFYKEHLFINKNFFSEQRVKICLQNAEEKDANIIGIDEYGFLKVKLVDGTVETVQPDGNSFDMLKGLIVPKYY